MLTCDLITNIPFHRLFDLHRINDSGVTCLFAERPVVEVDPLDAKKKIKAQVESADADYVGIEHGSARVLFLANQVSGC